MLKFRFSLKRALLSLLFLLFLLLAFYIGGVVGFFMGSNSASYLSDSEANLTSLALNKLRNENYSGAIDLLESRLDTEILHCDASKESHKSVFNIAWLIFRQGQKDRHNYLLSSVAEYRSKYPSTNMLPEVRQQIEEILKEASNKKGE